MTPINRSVGPMVGPSEARLKGEAGPAHAVDRARGPPTPPGLVRCTSNNWHDVGTSARDAPEGAHRLFLRGVLGRTNCGVDPMVGPSEGRL
jgi:hypothetical protein